MSGAPDTLAISAAARDADWARLVAVLPTEASAPADLVLVTPDAPRMARLPGPTLALVGLGPVVLHPGLAIGARGYAAGQTLGGGI